MATSQPLATDAALRVLEAGHTAVDAAVTAAAVLNGQAILKLETGWAAGSDPRKDGIAAGHA